MNNSQIIYAITEKCSKATFSLSQFVSNLENQISSNILEEGIQTRNKNNGVWCCFLVPTILVLYTISYYVPDCYRQISFISVGLLTHSILFILFLTVSSSVLKEGFGGVIPSSLVSTLLLSIFSDISLVAAFLHSFCSVILYGILLRECIVLFPKTFTIGELMIVLQGIVLFMNMPILLFTNKEDLYPDDYLVGVVLVTVLPTVGLVVAALVNICGEDRTLCDLGNIILGAALFDLLLLHFGLGLQCSVQLIRFIFFDTRRLKLLYQWLGLTVLSIGVVCSRTKHSRRANTATRKVFHVLASAVFTGGILMDVAFMRLAAGLALGLLILVETIRIMNIEPVSKALQSAFEIYKDEKDDGVFAVTALYMYLGLACPLALVPDHEAAPLELLSGVLATGVGDSAASVLGSRYGHTYWPGGKKTIEGTACNILSQLLMVCSLEFFGALEVRNAFFRTAVAATVVGLVEAKTSQIDNLVLPLVMLLSFQITTFIA